MNRLPARKRIMPIHRYAGVAPQFERTDGGYLFRRHGHGGAVFVTATERDAFCAAAMRALVLHALAFVAAAGVAWLFVKRLLDGRSDAVVAIVFGIVASLIAMALYASQRGYADAPGRALAHRPVVRPPREPEYAERQSYGTIVATTLALLFFAAIGTEQPASFYIFFATGAVMLGLFLAARRWLFDRGLTPVQRRRADEAATRDDARLVARARAYAQANPQSGWQVVLLLVFVAIQLVVLLGAMVLGVVAAAAIVGQSSDQLSFGPFMVGFLGGLTLGCLLAFPLDRLCKRWTGSSASDSLNWLPVGW